MHSGNIRFRALIQQYKPVYRDTAKKMKPSVSTKVVAIWRSQNPPGRFLTRSDRFHGSKRTFYDVGDAMARRKAAQCLREKSSKERISQLKEEEKDGGDPKNDESGNSEVEGGEEDSQSQNTSVGTKATDECTNGNNEEIDIMDQVFFSSRAVPQKLSAPSTTRSNFDLGFPDKRTMKNMVLTAKGKGFGCLSSCGSPKKDTLSLLDTYASKLELQTATEDLNQSSDSPFLFASFGFESDNQDNSDEGLSFPSLFGSSGNENTGNPFDEEDSSPGLFGDPSSAASLFEDEPEETLSLLPPTQKKVALQDICDSMPTAASLTSNFFDW
jgi:hypothetical protein